MNYLTSNEKQKHNILTWIFGNLPNYAVVFLDFYSNFGVSDKTEKNNKKTSQEEFN